MPILSDERRRAFLLWTGVKLSKSGKSIFNYNPGIYQSGFNFLLAWPLLPGFLNRAHVLQLLALYGLMHFYVFVLSDAGVFGPGLLDTQLRWAFANISGLANFVLGLFVSLVLSKTYYANRGCFGTVFGSSMGLTQMIVSQVRVPRSCAGNAAKEGCARDARAMMIRWINAAFRLMWLEAVPGTSAQAIGKEMVGLALLTQQEWDKIEGLSSRCTHIYQWIANVLTDLYEWGYIAAPVMLDPMHREVDKMRGANVWGLPSLPIAYTQMVTQMIKGMLIFLALNNGSCLSERFQMQAWEEQTTMQKIIFITVVHVDMAFKHYLYQGLLDLHGALYNPNAGILLGHLPSINFMDFVKDVSNHLDSENQTLPYKLELVDLELGVSADKYAIGRSVSKVDKL